MKALLIYVFMLILVQIAKSQSIEEFAGIDVDGDDAEVIFNKTYRDTQTNLEKAIFRKYSPLVRPVKDPRTPTVVDIHFHIVHTSIDQKQQTMIVHGHLYMRWRDELLGWDIDEFNGIRQMRVKKWQLWTPKIKVQNSVSGVLSTFEIASKAHVQVQTISKEKGANVEIYPTFSIKVGCAFDFSDYPNDVNDCSVDIYTPQKMSEVEMKVYASLPPTLMLGWGSQAQKKIVSDFEIVNVTSIPVYFSQRNITELKPISAKDYLNTWSMMRTTVFLKRHSAYYSVGILLPCLITISLSLVAFIIPSIPTAIYMFVMNTVIQAVFMEEIVYKVPKIVTEIPPIVSIYTMAIICNFFSLLLHLGFLILTRLTKYDPPEKVQEHLMEWSQHFINTEIKQTANVWSRMVASMRIFMFITLFVIYSTYTVFVMFF